MDIEASSPDDDAYPVEVSWSLQDGSVKSVLVLPDDDWEPWYGISPELDVQHLMDHGVTPADIVREINEDFSGETVYVSGMANDAALVEKLFESTIAEPDFEVATFLTLAPSKGLESILEIKRHISDELGLDPDVSQDRIRTMLFTARELGLT